MIPPITSWARARSGAGAVANHGRADQRRDEGARLTQVAALLPQPPDGNRDPERDRRVAPAIGPVDGRAQVRMLALELVERDPLPVAGELRRQLLRQREVRAGVTLPASPRRPLDASSRSSAYSRIGSSIENRGSPSTSPLRTRLWSTSDARRVEHVDGGGRAVALVRPIAGGGTGHGLRPDEVEAAHEDGEAFEQAALAALRAARSST